MEPVAITTDGDKVYDAGGDWDMGSACPLNVDGGPVCEACEG